jgi:hypothetical protein
VSPAVTVSHHRADAGWRSSGDKAAVAFTVNGASDVANIRTNYPLAQMPVSWHFPVDNKSVRNKRTQSVGRVVDFAGNVPFAQWSQLLKDEVDHFLMAAGAYEATPTGTTKFAASESLDRIESLIRAARRRLAKGDDK